MELEDSLSYSQVPTTCLYPEPDQSSPCPHPHPISWRSILILSSHNMPRSSKWCLLLRFPYHTLNAPVLSPVHATFPTHVIIYFITHMIYGEEYRSYCSSLCSLISSLVSLRPMCLPYHADHSELTVFWLKLWLVIHESFAAQSMLNLWCIVEFGSK